MNSSECIKDAIDPQVLSVIQDAGYCAGDGYSSAGGEFIGEGGAMGPEGGMAPGGDMVPGSGMGQMPAQQQPAFTPVMVPQQPAMSGGSTSSCTFVNKCWGFFSFRWFNNGESSAGYTCRCGIVVTKQLRYFKQHRFICSRNHRAVSS